MRPIRLIRSIRGYDPQDFYDTITRHMGPRIVIFTGPWKGKTIPVPHSGLTLGRGEENHICVDDDMLSRSHLIIRPENGHCLLVDLQTTNGTFINGFHFPSKILVHGDRGEAGSTRFVYFDRDEVDEDLAELIERHKDLPTARSSRGDAHDAAVRTILGAFLEMNASINTFRSPEQIQARVLDLILKVVSAERAAILLAGHDRDRIVSATYRRIGSEPGDPFPLDESIVQRALLDGEAVADPELGILCVSMTAFDTKVGAIYLVAARPSLENSSNYYLDVDHAAMLRSIAGFTAVALEHARYVLLVEGENERLKEAVQSEHGMIGRSEKMQEVRRFVSKAGPSGRTVLITGASGTGKGLVARAMHMNSPRLEKPFVPVNCGAFTETLLESELFGHEKGAFTGAVAQRKGLFEQADGGTIFLDEIAEIPISMQPSLLCVLQDGEFKRVGGTHSIRVNVRVIAATNCDLKQRIREGRFREDLYFRVNVVELEMPSLSERSEDIPLFASHFIKKHGYIRAESGMPPVLGIHPDTHRLLLTYEWPGNIRELEHAMERAITLGVSEYIRPKDLPKSLRKQSGGMEIGTYDDEFDAFRKALFERTLRKTGGDYRQAAQLLGLNVKYFYRICRVLKVQWR